MTLEGVNITILSDEALIEARNYYNSLLEPAFFVESAKYDAVATVVKEIEQEMTKRENEGPPWQFEEGYDLC